MNLIKIFTLFILLTATVVAQQTAPNTKAPVNVAPVSPANPGNVLQQSDQQTAPKKERTEQILIDPFSGSASTASIDVNTNPDLANFVDQTLVGVIVGNKKRIAVLQSAQGQINRFKRNEKINSEYKILEIYKDKILVASLDNNEYEVYFNNVIKPVEKKRKSINKKPVKLEQQLEDSLDPNVDPLAPKLAPKKETPVKKTTEPKAKTNKNKEKIKKADPVVTPKEEGPALSEIDEEELKQMKIIEEEMRKQITTDQQEKNKNVAPESIKKPATKKEVVPASKKEEIDDSYQPDLEPKVIREDSDLDKGEMEKLTDVDIEKIKEKLKK
jgi:hypothetical protein